MTNERTVHFTLTINAMAADRALNKLQSMLLECADRVSEQSDEEWLVLHADLSRSDEPNRNLLRR